MTRERLVQPIVYPRGGDWRPQAAVAAANELPRAEVEALVRPTGGGEFDVDLGAALREAQRWKDVDPRYAAALSEAARERVSEHFSRDRADLRFTLLGVRVVARLAGS